MGPLTRARGAAQPACSRRTWGGRTPEPASPPPSCPLGPRVPLGDTPRDAHLCRRIPRTVPVAARSSVLPCARKPSRARPNPLVQPSGPFPPEEEVARAGGGIQLLPLPSRCFGKRRTRGKVPGISPRGAWIFLFKKKKGNK